MALVACGFSDSGNSAAIRQKAADAVKRHQIQRDLEFGDLKEISEPETRSGRIFIPGSNQAPSAPVLSGASSIGQILLYIGAAILIILVALGLTKLIMDYRISIARKAIEREGLIRRHNDTSSTNLTPADQLAAEGKWEEAVHALLLASINFLSQEFGQQKSSQTSRELLKLFRLDEVRQSALRKLIAAVELLIFGRRPATAEIFAECRSSWQVIVGASQ